jgi:hypothetical protein
LLPTARLIAYLFPTLVRKCPKRSKVAWQWPDETLNFQLSAGFPIVPVFGKLQLGRTAPDQNVKISPSSSLDKNNCFI